jgi:hypothetical protein
MVVKKTNSGMEVVLDMGLNKNNPVFGWTVDYSIFQMMPIQRNTGERLKLKDSMAKHGYLAPYPLHCARGRNGKYLVKGGQGRLKTAQDLGLPVVYCVSTDTATLAELELATVIWRLMDFLEGHIRDEKQPYLIIREIFEKYRVPISLLLPMLSGDTTGSKSKMESFKEGTFQIIDGTHAMRVGEFVSLVRDTLGHKKLAKLRSFGRAVDRVLRIKEVNIELLRKKLITFSRYLEIKHTIADHIKQLELIYNRKTPIAEQVAIEFLADQLVRVNKKTD